MQVLKFGGTSVGSTENIEKVTQIVLKALERDKTIVVSSAFSGVTDKLIELGKVAASPLLKGKDGQQQYEAIITALEKRHFDTICNLIPIDYRGGIDEEISEYFEEIRNLCNGIFKLKELSFSTLDALMSFGELCSTKIIATKFSSMGLSCKWIDSRELIKTHYAISQNIVDTKVSYKNIDGLFSQANGNLFIMPGFIARDSNDRATTLGRGGSDYTASIVAAGVKARLLEIWTDVCGMMTADPRIVSEANTIRNISYKEALELSHFGAKVVYPPTIQPVIKYGIPIAVRNTFAPDDKGTLIEANPPESENKIKGLSGSDNLALISMEGSGMVGIPGYSSRLFDVLYKNEINIILITQASSVHTMLIAIDDKDADRAKCAVDEFFAYEISLGKIEPLKIERGYSIISLVGDNMKNQSGAGGRMFEALGKRGITIRAIAQGSSERNVSAVVETKDVDNAIKAIHKEFFGSGVRTINLFIAGFGNVGKELIKIINSQNQQLSVREGVIFKITGLCNSRKMIISPEGIQLSNIDSILETAENTDLYQFVNTMKSYSCGKTLFIDCTSNNDVASLYRDILLSGCNVVAANKIANSSSFQNYLQIRKAAQKGRTKFVYETNVGAALPIISTINSLVRSGDSILKIEAMVSGSLNYIFSNYCSNESISFWKSVKNAQTKGFTEPNPMTDLSGIDVKRKAIILAREAGYEIEPSEVIEETPLPNDDSVEHLFSSLRAEAIKSNCKLRYLATIEKGEVRIGLKMISSDHPFYNVEGVNAAVAISTKRYPSPIVISGAGAGGEVTAAGIYNDILTLI